MKTKKEQTTFGPFFFVLKEKKNLNLLEPSLLLFVGVSEKLTNLEPSRNPTVLRNVCYLELSAVIIFSFLSQFSASRADGGKKKKIDHLKDKWLNCIPK